MGKKSIAIEKELGEVRANMASVEREVDEITATLEAKRRALGDAMLQGKEYDLKDLQALEGEKNRREILLDALARQVRGLEHDLAKARAEEYERMKAEMIAESRKKLVEVVRLVYELYKCAVEYTAMQSRFNIHLRDKYGRGGIDSMTIPVNDIVYQTHHWLGRETIDRKQLSQWLRDVGIPSFAERRRFALEKHNGSK